ncbi:hypothetical protein [Actinoplanes auranticolor]|uniref:Uncharacterized protein n=1 Tax=Actinoplanes auranticolor TaxID=47988 RepID=A0A919VZ65_9ACTN|nr:hypothetical protein [Actinoplanes auranticolor]GIM80110.1 hypothetical protein Aau02nite_89020 [Actinoplanes auranticolor]
MAIFSAITRTDPSPAGHGDGQFTFLDRVSGTYWDQVRDLIEEWFSRLCPDAQADVRGRMRSKDNRQFMGAFFELYLHECLLRMGYSVTCHPVLEGTTRRPDFLAERDGRSVYVEARSASASNVSVGAEARVNVVYESIDRLDSPNFFLWIEVVRQGPGSLRAKPLRGRLERWLSGLDPENYTLGGRRDDLPSHRYEEAESDGGWIIKFWAIPKSPEARGRVGARPLGVFGRGGGRINDEDGIRGALSDKGAAYGPLGVPFIVAVASSSMSLDDHDVRNVLYGTEMLQITTALDGTESQAYIREPNGYWYAGDRWEHRGVSAVLVVKQLHPAFVGNQQHTIWEHPDPDHAVEALPLWRRSLVGADGWLEFVEPPRTQADWFGLGDPWPIGDPFPREV